MYDGIQLRVVPLDGCYMLQRYRPDFEDWCNVAVYATEAQALQRASKYAKELA